LPGSSAVYGDKSVVLLFKLLTSSQKKRALLRPLFVNSVDRYM